jgi:HSP20 family protein
MLARYNPFFDFDEFTKGLSLFQDAATRFMPHEGESARPWAPAVDIAETENELILKADLPEVKLENIDVRLENGTLTLKGKREFEKKEQDKGYHRIERGYGAFTRAFTLPETVDPEKVTADYQAGVLTVKIGKKEIAKPRSVKVNIHA